MDIVLPVTGAAGDLVFGLERLGALAGCPQWTQRMVCPAFNRQYGRDFGNHIPLYCRPQQILVAGLGCSESPIVAGLRGI